MFSRGAARNPEICHGECCRCRGAVSNGTAPPPGPLWARDGNHAATVSFPSLWQQALDINNSGRGQLARELEAFVACLRTASKVLAPCVEGGSGGAGSSGTESRAAVAWRSGLLCVCSCVLLFSPCHLLLPCKHALNCDVHSLTLTHTPLAGCHTCVSSCGAARILCVSVPAEKDSTDNSPATSKFKRGLANLTKNVGSAGSKSVSSNRCSKSELVGYSRIVVDAFECFEVPPWWGGGGERRGELKLCGCGSRGV